MRSLMKIRLPKRLRNKYALVSATFLVWLVFFDSYDVFTQMGARAELREMRQEKQHYLQEIEKTDKALKELSTDKALLERFAREEYLMKRDNEDIYVIVPETDQPK